MPVALSGAELIELLRAAGKPARAEVLEAKRLLLNLLSDGEPHDPSAVELELHTEPVAQDQFMHELNGDTEDLDILREEANAHPVARVVRVQMAVYEAAAELTAEGLAISVEQPDQSQLEVLPHTTSMQVRFQGVLSALSIKPQYPSVPASGWVRLPHGLREKPVWLFHVDGFLDGLGPLELPARVRRGADEALHSYRRGLYLASATLLALVAEGAWRTVADLIVRTDTKSLREAIDKDAKLAKLQDTMLKVLEGSGVREEHRNELRAMAQILRSIRNYAAHPRPDEQEILEGWFDEDRCAQLIVMTRRHLEVLSAAVATSGEVQQHSG